MAKVMGCLAWQGMAITAPALEAVLNQVFLETGVTTKEVLSDRKIKRVAHARQYAMWKLRQIQNGDRCKYSTIEIGRVFKRDHTTVIHALRQVEKRLSQLVVEDAA